LLNLACDKEEYSDTYNTISNFDYKESSDGMNAYVEYWGFGYLPQLRDAVEFYINNEILFRNFLNHFKYETRHVTLRAERQRMFYYLDNFFVAEHESTGCISSQQVCVEDRKDSMTSGSLGNIRPKRIDITHNNVNLSISYRQFQCLCYVSSGYSFKEVASLLGISSKSVEFHIYKIKETTRCRYKSDLIEMVKKNNLNMCLLKS
jgi:DNA-binding CsgD family transcriptional regulator